jgi:hypothetical protein
MKVISVNENIYRIKDSDFMLLNKATEEDREEDSMCTHRVEELLDELQKKYKPFLILDSMFGV